MKTYRKANLTEKELNQMLLYLFEHGYGEMTVKDLMELHRQGVTLLT